MAALGTLWPRDETGNMVPSYRVGREPLKEIARQIDWSRLVSVQQRDREIFIRWTLGATLEQAGKPLSRERTRGIVNTVTRKIMGHIIRARKQVSS